MFKFLIMVCAFTLTACSHTSSHPEVSSFIQNLRGKNEYRDNHYLDKYQSYLNTVAKVYKDNNQEQNFRFYLDSLTSNSQTLAQLQGMLPNLYRKKTGRAIASDVSSYELFKTLEMTKLSDSLFEARELQIKDEVGNELYQDLQANYKDFMIKEEADEFGFPL